MIKDRISRSFELTVSLPELITTNRLDEHIRITITATIIICGDIVRLLRLLLTILPPASLVYIPSI